MEPAAKNKKGVWAYWLTNGLTLANSLQAWVVFIIKRNHPEAVGRPKPEAKCVAVQEVEFEVGVNNNISDFK